MATSASSPLSTRFAAIMDTALRQSKWGALVLAFPANPVEWPWDPGAISLRTSPPDPARSKDRTCRGDPCFMALLAYSDATSLNVASPACCAKTKATLQSPDS
eukprot:scaffold283_cov316-Pavlova_lutheri.AAC.24